MLALTTLRSWHRRPRICHQRGNTGRNNRLHHGRLGGGLKAQPIYPTSTRCGLSQKDTLPGSGGLSLTSPTPRVRASMMPFCLLKYTSVEVVAAATRRLGESALLAKMDINLVYRLVPFHPSDRPMLGVRCKGAFYVDVALLFGLRSPTTAALQWVMVNTGVSAVDY